MEKEELGLSCKRNKENKNVECEVRVKGKKEKILSKDVKIRFENIQ